MPGDAYSFVLMIPVFLFSIVIHEVAHAYSAKLAGDMTATELKRLSMNPFYHIDLVGTVILPIIAFIRDLPLIGWAKPVPVDPRQFRRPYWEIIVSLAGPFSNFALAIFSAFLLKLFIILFSLALSPLVVIFLKAFVKINLLLGLFNLIPIPPLDGSHVLRYFLIRLNPTADKFFFVFDRIGFILLYLFILFPPTLYLFRAVYIGLLYALQTFLGVPLLW